MPIVEFHRDRQNLRPEQIDDPDVVVPSSSSWREIKNKPGRFHHGYGRCGLGSPECMHEDHRWRHGRFPKLYEDQGKNRRDHGSGTCPGQDASIEQPPRERPQSSVRLGGCRPEEPSELIQRDQ
ncbi:MAG TPA: hypothetical protein VK302_10525 [Terriglobales bacterium]|nr:hypothetical protein [Terriglobales bacterium]